MKYSLIAIIVAALGVAVAPAFAKAQTNSTAPMFQLRCGDVQHLDIGVWKLAELTNKAKPVWTIKDATYKAIGAEKVTKLKINHKWWNGDVRKDPKKFGVGCGCIFAIVDWSRAKVVKINKAYYLPLGKCAALRKQKW